MGAAESKISRDVPKHHHPNFFDRIPKELTDLIISRLEIKDLAHISCCCKKFRSEVFIEPIPFQQVYYLNGDYHDEMQMIAQSEDFDRTIKKVFISVDWYDQGWGNQKGTLYLCLFNKKKEQLEIQQVFPEVAPHGCKHVEATIGSNAAVVRNARIGDHYEMWRYVGGGGGHQLNLINLKCIIFHSSKSETEKIVKERNLTKERESNISRFMSQLQESQFTSSNENNENNNKTSNEELTKPFDSRLTFQHLYSCWKARENETSDVYIQVDLLKEHRIVDMCTQGNEIDGFWVETFQIATSKDGLLFTPINHIFNGNKDKSSIVHQNLESFQVIGRYFRLIPLSFHERISLRFGIYGIQTHEEIYH